VRHVVRKLDVNYKMTDRGEWKRKASPPTTNKLETMAGRRRNKCDICFRTTVSTVSNTSDRAKQSGQISLVELQYSLLCNKVLILLGIFDN
jgi:hypothetical protein